MSPALPEHGPDRGPRRDRAGTGRAGFWMPRCRPETITLVPAHPDATVRRLKGVARASTPVAGTASVTSVTSRRIVRHVPAGEGSSQVMATVTFEKAQRWYPGNDTPTVPGIDLEIGDGEFMVLVGPVRVRQVHDAADARRARGGQRRQDLHRGPRHHQPAAQGPRHRDGLPELRALPAHVRRRQHGVRAEDGQGARGRAQEARRTRPPRSSA